MKKTITGVLIDPQLGLAEKRTIERGEESYRSLLRSSDVEIVSCTIGGKQFDILYDGGRPWYRRHWPSALGRFRRPKLYGPLFVIKAVWETGPEGLSDEDAAFVLNNVHPLRHSSVPVLCNVSFDGPILRHLLRRLRRR